MRVVYIGNFVPHHSTENCVARGFEQLGWTVDRWQEADFIKKMSANSNSRRDHRRVLGADLVLHTLTQGFMPRQRSTLAMWKACRDHGTVTASVHLDLFYGLSSPKGHRGPQRNALPREHPMFRVDHVFTADGGNDALWKRDGINHHWLPPGVDGDEALDVDVLDSGDVNLTVPVFADLLEGRYLVGFAGSDRYHAEWPHRRALLEHLREWYGPRFLHIGGTSTPRVTGLALNRVLGAVPVWVGDSCLTRPDFAYWSDRVPETWGRGGFLIHPKVHALDEHYADAHAALPSWHVDDWSTLRAKIDGWLDDPAMREHTRRSLAAHTRAHDTYRCRVQSMLDTMGLS